MTSNDSEEKSVAVEITYNNTKFNLDKFNNDKKRRINYEDAFHIPLLYVGRFTSMKGEEGWWEIAIGFTAYHLIVAYLYHQETSKINCFVWKLNFLRLSTWNWERKQLGRSNIKIPSRAIIEKHITAAEDLAEAVETTTVFTWKRLFKFMKGVNYLVRNDNQTIRTELNPMFINSCYWWWNIFLSC